MSRQQIAHHYSRLLTRWPLDRLRPEIQFQNLLRKRIQAAPSGTRDEKKEVNAAYLLLDNSFAKHYPVSEEMLKPRSNPAFYTELEKELNELPDRTWWGNVKKRFSSMVRLK